MRYQILNFWESKCNLSAIYSSNFGCLPKLCSPRPVYSVYGKLFCPLSVFKISKKILVLRASWERERERLVLLPIGYCGLQKDFKTKVNIDCNSYTVEIAGEILLDKTYMYDGQNWNPPPPKKRRSFLCVKKNVGFLYIYNSEFFWLHKEL